MSLVGEQTLLRIYLQSADRAPRISTFVRVVHAAKIQKMAGATVLRGIEGAGYHEPAKASAWSLAERVPIIVEIVDRPERITAFVQDTLNSILRGGMITLERAAVMMYRSRKQDQPRSLSLAAALDKPLSTTPLKEMGNNMTIQENGVLVRIFIGESDRFEKEPLHKAILGKVRQLGLAGATVLRGSDGFGAHSVVHKTALLEMSSDLPIVIEVVDTEEKIKMLLPHLETMVQEGLITMEHVAIVIYRQGPAVKAAGN